MIEFFHEAIANRLAEVSARLRPLFAALVVERLLPHAEVFFQGKEPQLLKTTKNAVELLWRFGITGTIEEHERQQTLTECVKVIQYAEEIDTEDALLASDAVAAIVYGLRAIESDDPKEPAWAAQRAYDTVFRFAQGQSAEGSSAANIEEHPVVQQELERQMSDIMILRNLRSADAATINDLRNAARRQSKNLFSAGSQGNQG